MKKLKKITAVLISVCMLVAMLPAHIALAAVALVTDTPSDYITYGTLETLKTSNFRGAVYTLEKIENHPSLNSEQYKLTVGMYNVSGVDFIDVFQYWGEDVSLLASRNGNKVTSINATKVTGAMEFESVETYKDLLLTDKGKTMYGVDADDGGIPEDAALDYIFGGSGGDPTVLFSREKDGEYYQNKIIGSFTPNIDIWYNEYFIGESKGTDNTGDIALYTSPADELINIYSLYFVVNDGATVDEDTFTLYPDTNDGDVNTENSAVFGGITNVAPDDPTSYCVPDYDQHGAYFIGFPTPPASPQNIKFNMVEDADHNPINNATIKIYEGENLVTTINGSASNDGTYITTETVPAYTEYNYTVESDGYVTKTGDIDVKAATATVPTITMTLLTDQTYKTEITVTDGDTGAYLPGASISINGTTVGETASATTATTSIGVFSGEYKASLQNLTVSLTGYQPFTTTFTPTASSNTTTYVNIELTPERQEVTLPLVRRSIDNNIESDAALVIKKVSDNETRKWSDTTTSGGEKVYLPKKTKYSLTASKTGFTDSTIYMNIAEDGTVTYYSDSGFSTVYTGDIKINKLSDPYYSVDITSESKTYTAKVTVHNIDATFGTFGIKYDKKLFDFRNATGFSLNSDKVALYDTPAGWSGSQPLPSITYSDSSNTDETTGYHVFTWQPKSGATLNSINEDVLIATYTFTLKDGKTSNDLTADSFSVMPFDKTKVAAEYAKENITTAWDEDGWFAEKWRYVDEDNEADTLKEGRLEKSKAIINGADTEGFYQAFVYSTLTNNVGTLSDVYDIRTYVNYEFTKSSLTFSVVDKDTNIPVEGASVQLYDSTGENLIETIKTDVTGYATYAVNTALGDVTYNYLVFSDGYWNYPENTKKEIVVPQKSAKSESVQLQKKIYHEPVLQYTDGSSAEDDLVLGGDSYAYYEHGDFNFSVKPAQGKKFASEPSTVKVIVGGDTENPITLTIDPNTNTFSLPEANITGEPFDTPADSIGFKSDEIIIQVDKTDAEVTDDDRKFTVTANTDEHGTVEYTPGGGAEESASTQSNTHKVLIENVELNAKTGTFKFEADTENGYQVEKVYVNGVQIHDYDNVTNFEYQFGTDGTIEMDNNIIVTFWDGTTSSNDSIITLVVGDYGTAKLTDPASEAGDVKNTRKIFLNEDYITFKAVPDSGYQLAEVKTQINRGDTGDSCLSRTGDVYTVRKDENDNVTVYVTFKKDGADNSPTIFVNSHIDSGRGIIEPAGILIYNYADTPTFTMTPNTDLGWQSAGVRIAPFTDETNGERISFTPTNDPTTYTLPSLTEDKSIGAIFEEVTYTVTGTVDLSQNKSTLDSNNTVVSPAYLTFVRTDENDNELEGETPRNAETGTVRTDAAFNIKLPKGYWRVTITKPGYINYTITGFEVKEDGNNIFGYVDASTTRKIVPIIGDTTGTGKNVSLTDAANIQGGMRSGLKTLNEALWAKADVNDDNLVNEVDLSYVKFNYGQRVIKKTYGDFLAGN